MKNILKKLIPEKLFLIYHFILAFLGATRYGFPANRMLVIGVTGTKGKTSTANYIWSALMAGGIKTGMISTANIRIGEKEFVNDFHMTMPGRWNIQRLMSEMRNAGCTHCVIETTSEGIKQFRNLFVYYDIAVFTNLTPEHLPSHGGSFDEYREMKGKLFSGLTKHRKTINGKNVEKTIIANKDSEFVDYYMGFPADKKISFSVNQLADVRAEKVIESKDGVDFTVGTSSFHLGILGGFNAYNALPSIIIGRMFGISDIKIANGLRELIIIPGRMEVIDEGQKFHVIVDYAHEKKSIGFVLKTANLIKNAGSRTIILLGAEGGGRDKSKRPIMGELAAKLADFVVVSNVDPYDDDPVPILEDIATSAEKNGKIRGQDLYVIADRRDGIRKALALAQSGDVVLLTGKGAEQAMIIGGKSIPWDDRVVVREELKANIVGY